MLVVPNEHGWHVMTEGSSGKKVESTEEWLGGERSRDVQRGQ